MLRTLRLATPISNAWLLPDIPEGPILIDTGHAFAWRKLQRGLRRASVEPQDLAACVLTHRHSDHAGNAERLAQEHGVNIYAHPADAAMLRGDVPRPKLKTAATITGFMSALENRYPSRCDTILPIEEGETVGGLQVFGFAGHTVGSIGLYHAPTATLFCGDGILNAVPPLAAVTRLVGPDERYCDDYPQALSSIEQFLKRDLPLRVLCTGHGPRLEGDDLRRRIHTLLRDAG
jgi:glyoxylase-like metal-dependent hydrolase (beta-lactamase superfamily II)